MPNRVGVGDSCDPTDYPLFVRRNEIFYRNNYDMPSYIGAAPYGSERNWYNRPNTPCKKDEEFPMNVDPPVGRKAQIEDDKEVVKSGCSGKNFDVFSDETSFHGLKHIKGGNNWGRRVSWIIILILALLGLSYQINRSVSKYFSYPTNTNINYVTKSSIPFPKATVCNINMFKFDEVTPLMGGYALFYVYGLQYLRSLAPDVGITSSENEYGRLTEESYPGDKNLQQFIKYNGHRIQDMLEVCIFNGIECGPENFTLTYTNYGPCYVFNPTLKVALKHTGQRYGLSMILNVEHIEYITAPRENVGFRIAIDGHNDAPDLEASGVDVATGMRASIGLRKQTITSLSYPYGECIIDGERQLKYQVNEPYSQSRCLLECETDYFMKECGCRTYYTPGTEDQMFCAPVNLTGCYLPKYEDFADHREEFCDCEEACDVVNFMKTNSFSGFPSRGVPLTFYVTQQYKYYALALGFNIKQRMEVTRNEISFYVLDEALDELVLETAMELNLPIDLELPPEYDDRLYWEFGIFCYDLTFYLVKQISDNIYYDVSAGVLGSESNDSTRVGSGFYNRTLEKADHELSNQIESIVDTIVELTLLFETENFTREDALEFSEVLMGKLYVYVYPLVWNPCYEYGETIFTTNDIAFLTREYMADNLVRVDIYYESLNVEEVKEQIAYELFSIVCDLGGAFGLFFGASLVAFVEAIDFWFIKGCCGPKKK